MEDCIFCKISNKELPTEFLYETDDLVVFADIHPSAPVHYLIIPKVHYQNLSDTPDDVWVKIKKMALEIADKEGHKGFRLGNNYGNAAMVKHMHIHYLSGITKTRKI